MNRQRYELLQSIFNRSIELEGDERSAYLDEACAGDEELRREVELFLDRDEKAECRPLIGRAEAMVAGAIGAASEPVPERIGDYRILKKIGEGGMGRVYLAQQEDPHRRVALKVIRPELLSPTLCKRFKLEVEVLGKLQHPGVAQIHDAGRIETPSGSLPYFAMEYVQGVGLREYVKNHDLSMRERLELAARICDAAHHAHVNGIVHRDLKPDNVLVVEDGSGRIGQPKVLDFGVARATDADLQVTTLKTDVGKLLGTITYMSPEQVAGDSRSIDRRSDVYSLGSILYELLAGRPPFSLGKKPIPEAARVIREEEPARLGSIHTDFQGDVDTIVTKALEKDRDRRYPTAADLAAEIRRHLSDQPITAHPPSAFYELKKFARRHRGLVAGLVLSFLILLAGATVSLSFMVRATRNEAAIRRSAHWLKITMSRALGDTEPAHAMEYLEEVPEAYRDWEWRHQYARLACHVNEHSGDHVVDCAATLARRPDGVIVAALNRDGGIEVVDAATGETQVRIEGPNGLDVRALSPDGSMLAAWSSEEKKLSLWDIGRDERIREISLEGDNPVCRFDPENSLLAFRDSCGGMVHMVATTPDGAAAGEKRSLRESEYEFAFDPEGARFMIPNQWSLNLYSGSGEKLGYEIDPTGRARSVAFSPDGSRIAVGYCELVINIFDAKTLEIEKVLSGHSHGISAVAFSQDGSCLASASWDRTVRVWDLSNGQPLRALFSFIDEHPTALAFSADGGILVAANSKRARIWKWREGGRRVCDGHEDYVYQIDFHPDGSLLASAAFSGPIRLWEPITGELLGVVPTSLRRKCLGFNVDGSRLVYSDKIGESPQSRPGFACLDPAAGEPVVSPRQPGDAWIAGPPPRGAEVFEVTPRIRLIKGAGENTVLSPDGSLYAQVSDKTEIHLHDMNTGELVGRVGRHDSQLWSVAFSPDSSIVAGGDAEGLVKLWDLESGTEVATLREHIGRVYSIAFSPDGRRIVTGGSDKNIHLWDSETFEQITMLRGHDSYVHSLRFSPDGTMLASASGDGTVRIWDTIIPAERWRHILREKELEPEARSLVDRLLKELEDPLEVADRLRGDTGLDEDLRTVALRCLLRQSGIGVKRDHSP